VQVRACVCVFVCVRVPVNVCANQHVLVCVHGAPLHSTQSSYHACERVCVGVPVCACVCVCVSACVFVCVGRRTLAVGLSHLWRMTLTCES